MHPSKMDRDSIQNSNMSVPILSIQVNLEAGTAFDFVETPRSGDYGVVVGVFFVSVLEFKGVLQWQKKNFVPSWKR